MAEAQQAPIPARPGWPPHKARHLTLPDHSLWVNVEVSALRHPHKAFIVFHGKQITFAQFRAEAELLAGWLQQRGGIVRGDRVLLAMQNSPQWALGYYAILRADAVVVPVNPMNKGEELEHLAAHAGARVALVAEDLLPAWLPLLEGGKLDSIVVATYSDHIDPEDADIPSFVAAPRTFTPRDGLVAWRDAVGSGLQPGPHTAGPSDLAVLPYSSGTTGKPKGCMHTHRSTMATAVGGVQWFERSQDSIFLATLPFFHVTGMAGSLNGPLYAGSTIVILGRWDRKAALRAIARHRVDTLHIIASMGVDLLAEPDLATHDLSSLRVLRGGGAPMPQAVWQRLKDLTGAAYVEGYGMSEAMGATHINPLHWPKGQCLGLPLQDVDARVVDLETQAELPAGQSGEIIIDGPQVMQGYWNDPEATAAVFLERDGKRFLRTGDIGMIDPDGYFVMTDRLKRMVNASGFKVWPAEVEALLHHHPAVLTACIISARDPQRGETVKAFIVRRPGAALQAEELIEWARGQMAAYKVPRMVAFVDALPLNASGKVMWRQLQEQQDREDAERNA